MHMIFRKISIVPILFFRHSKRDWRYVTMTEHDTSRALSWMRTSLSMLTWYAAVLTFRWQSCRPWHKMRVSVRQKRNSTRTFHSLGTSVITTSNPAAYASLPVMLSVSVPVRHFHGTSFSTAALKTRSACKMPSFKRV